MKKQLNTIVHRNGGILDSSCISKDYGRQTLRHTKSFITNKTEETLKNSIRSNIFPFDTPWFILISEHKTNGLEMIFLGKIDSNNNQMGDSEFAK